MDVDGFPAARRLSQSNVAADGWFDDHVAQMLAEQSGHLLVQQGRSVHRHQHAVDPEPRIQAAADLFNRGQEHGQAFEGEIFGLHGDKHAVCSTEGVDGQHTEVWWRVDEHQIVVRQERRDAFCQARFAAKVRQNRVFDGDETSVADHHVQGWYPRGVAAVRGTFRGQEEVAGRQFNPRLVDAQTGGAVALGVQIHHEHALARSRQTCGEVDHRRGFSNPALLIGDRNNARKPLGRGLHRRKRERCSDFRRPDLVGRACCKRRFGELFELRLADGHLPGAFSHRSVMHAAEALEVTAHAGPRRRFGGQARHAGRSIREVAKTLPLVASTATLSVDSQP